jgi:AcrR family transcriptional regulator
VRKGEATRQQIVDTALQRASELGLEGVTLGRLAEELQISKSGLFAHFKSKEALQIAVLEEAIERFTERVVRPMLVKPRGAPRVRELFERWIAWFQGESDQPEEEILGCPFLSLSSEYDDRPGAVRDALVRCQKDWIATVAKAATLAVREGHFRADLDPEQFAFEFKGIGMALQHAAKLVADPSAERRARAAFARLLADASAPLQ